MIWGACSLSANEQDSIQVEIWLKDAACLSPDSCRTLYFAKQMLGVPYVAGTLDGNEEEQLVVNVHQLDCTTLVETVIALCIADRRGERSFKGFKKALMDVRYRDGVLDGYASRLHYFSDWIRDNERMGFVRECTTETSCSQPQTLWLDFMSMHAGSYLPLKKDTSLITGIAAMEQAWRGVEVCYIPKDKLHLSSKELQIADGDILAITTSIKGLDVVHVGFAFWKGEQLHLLHASSVAKKVIEDSQSLYEYSKNKKAHTGVRAVRVVL